MKYLTLGQAFKFYCFQPESIRNEIAKTFSSLYANDHEKPIRISPRRLSVILISLTVVVRLERSPA